MGGEASSNRIDPASTRDGLRRDGRRHQGGRRNGRVLLAQEGDDHVQGLQNRGRRFFCKNLNPRICRKFK